MWQEYLTSIRHSMYTDSTDSRFFIVSRRILQEGKPAVDDYIRFLSGGSSNYPIELLKGAGVDMSTKEPVNQALKLFEELLDQMEELML